MVVTPATAPDHPVGQDKTQAEHDQHPHTPAPDQHRAGRTTKPMHEADARCVRMTMRSPVLGASGRSTAGHRLYASADVERLYRICLLRRLGLPLGEIGRALDDPAWNLRTAMTSHLAELEGRLEAAGRLRGRLTQLVGSIGTDVRPTTQDLLDLWRT